MNKEEHDKLINSEAYKRYDALFEGDAITSPGYESSYDLAVQQLIERDNLILRQQEYIRNAHNQMDQIIRDLHEKC